MARRVQPFEQSKRKGLARVPSQTIPEDSGDLLPFMKQDIFSDVALMVSGRKLFTARSLLAYNSPVFERMLSHGKKQDLDLPQKDYDDIVELLSYIDPRVRYQLTESTARQLLPLAEEYEIFRLRRSCEEVLSLSYKSMRKDYSLGTIPAEVNEAYMALADKYRFEPLLRLCVDEFVHSPDSQNTRSLVDAEVSDQLKLMILDRKLARINKELTKERKHRNDAESVLSDITPRRRWRYK